MEADNFFQFWFHLHDGSRASLQNLLQCAREMSDFNSACKVRESILLMFLQWWIGYWMWGNSIFRLRPMSRGQILSPKKLPMWKKISDVKENCQCERKLPMWKKISDVNGNFQFALLGQLAGPGREQKMGSKIGKFIMWKKIFNVNENFQCERRLLMWTKIAELMSK